MLARVSRRVPFKLKIQARVGRRALSWGYLYFVIKNNSIDDLPNFIWDLIDLEEENKLHIYDIIGFATSDNFTKGEIMAMYGIGIKRFGEIYDMPISKKAALKALDQHPRILKRFKETFPFIKIED